MIDLIFRSSKSCSSCRLFYVSKINQSAARRAIKLSGLATGSGASWVSFHHGGGVGIGYSLHAGQVTVADGTDEGAQRLNRVLTNDPGLGVARHVDAGYEEAIETAQDTGINIPSLHSNDNQLS